MGIKRYNLNSRSRIQITIDKSNEVYADSNFLLYCFIKPSSLDPHVDRQRFKLAKQLLFGFLQKKIRIVISSLALDEAWYIYLKLLYQKDHGKDAWTPNTLKNHPEIITTYKDNLEKLQKSILAHPYRRLVGVPDDAIAPAFNNMISFQLGPRDSFHLAVCCHEETECLVTGDRDFRRIPSDCGHINLNLIIF